MSATETPAPAASTGAAKKNVVAVGMNMGIFGGVMGLVGLLM